MTAPENGAPTMGHIALHYPRAVDGPAAVKLLTLLGFVETQALPLPQGNFYRFVVSERHHSRGDGILYLSAVPPAQQALVDATREALGYGTDHEHPAIGDLRRAMEADPEYCFHVGTLVGSLEELERIALELQERNQSDPDLKGRLKITINRPRLGDAAIDARLDASPAFGKVQRYAYGRNGVQLFVETDLLASGPLGESMVMELDYIFPGHDSHILSIVEL
jgi:hypothetical protein